MSPEYVKIVDTSVIMDIMYREMLFATGDETALSIGFETSAYTIMESEKEASVCLFANGGVGTEVFEVYIQSLDITTQGATL